MRKTWRRIASVILALAMVVLALPEYVSPVKKAKAAATKKTVYVLTDTISNGEYLFVNRNTSGSGVAMASSGTTLSTANVTIQTSQDEVIGIGAQYIDGDAEGFPAGAVWTAAADEANNQMRLTNSDTKYLQVAAGNYNTNNVVLSENIASTNETYSQFSWRGVSGKLYVVYHNRNHQQYDSEKYIHYENSRYTAVNGGGQGNVYVYQKRVICNHDEYNCSFDWDMRWVNGEYRVSAIASFTCTGCGKAVSVVDATISCSETTGTCAQKPQWTYTAKAKDPKGTEWTDTKDPMNQITEDTDPDAQITGTVYVLSYTVQTGKKYLIVDANSAGAAHALANGFPAPYNNDFDVKSRDVTIKAETLKIGSPDSYEETESVYIEAAPSDAVWLCSAANPPYVSSPSNITNDLYFSNGDYYLTHLAGSSVSNPRIYLAKLNTSENRYATWNIEMVNNLRYSGGRNNYYIGYNNGWQGLSNTSRHVYYFVETTITMNGFKEVEGGTHQFPLTHVSRVESGCEHAGNEEYWKCERCQTLFSDENGENETTAEAVVIPAAHDWQFDHFEWTQDSKNGYVSATAIYKCSRESTHTVEVTAPTVTDSELEMTEGSDADTFTAYVSATDSPDGREHGEDKTLAKYAVSFQLADGSAYGNPVYYYEGTLAADIDVPEDPEIEPDESYIYHFNGWKDGENGIHDVDGTVVYKATYTTEDVLYSVTWIVNGNETPEEDAYKHGDTPVYPGAQEPIMTPSAEFEYTFTGWSDGASEFPKSQDLPAIDNKDVTYTAVFESSKRSYTVEFIVEEKVVQTGAVEYGTSPSFTGETPTKTAEGNVVYTFKGWKLSGSDTVYGPTDTLPTVDENGATYTAVFEETTLYDINIDDAQNGTIRTDRTNNKAEAGETVTLTFEPAEGGYSLFSYWVEGPDGEITCDTTSGITFTMPAGAVAVHAVFGKYFPVWIAGTQITTVNQDNVLGDAAGSERITFSETTDKYVLTILTGDEITLNNNADVWNSLQKALIYIADTATKPLEIVASDGLKFTSETAYHGIFNESGKDLTVNGNVSIKLASEIEGGQELNGIYCCYSAMTITGDVTLSFPNGKYGNGFGLFTTAEGEGKNITITGDVDITGAGSSAIQCGNDLTVKGDKFSIEGLGDSDDLNYIYGVCAEGDVLIDCKTDGVSVYGVDYAITSVGKVKIIGDVDAVGKNDNAIDSGDKVTIEGNVLLGSGCNGIYAKSIDITGDVSMSDNHKFMSIGGCLLYSFEGDIKVDGSIKADCPEGYLLYARGLSEGAGKITVTNDITGLEGDAAETADGISAWAGITINGNVDMQVTNEGPVIGDVADNAKHYGINAGIGDLAIDGTLKLICADTVDYGLFVLNGETENGTVTLGDEVSITMGGSGYGIYATGTITLPEARTEISTNDGIAIYTPCIRENDIVIPDGYGISTPEDGEVKVIADTAEDAMYDDCYTIVDPASPDVAASVVVIEPYIEVQFVNADEDQTVLATTKGFVGKAPKYTGETPTKKETDAETYTFDGWSYGEATYASGDLPTITEDMTGPIIFTAAYLVETKQYEVTFYDEDGKTVLLETATYDYGTKPEDITTPKTPTKKDDDQYTYEFEGWDPELAEVTKNAAYTAKYKKVLKEFTIKFVNEDGKELQSTKVAYGTKPTYTGATPTKAADSQYTYTFKEWSPEIVTVTGEATYKATYDKKEISADDPVEEKGEYQLIGDKKISYKQKSGAVIKAQIKCTLHDENTFSKHKDVKSSKRTLVEGVDYKKTKGSVIIEFLPEYLDSLEVGSTMITVSFEDGNDVEIELEILPADAEEQKESPKTDDSMVFAWIIFLIGAASFSFMLIAKKREREERVGL